MATRKPSRAARSAKRPARKPQSRPARKAAASRKPKAARSARRPAAPPAAAAAPRTAFAGGLDKRRHDPQTLRLRSYEPSLTVNDLAKSIEFYTKVLGFIQGDRWEDKGVLKGIQLKAGALTLGLSQDDWSKGRDRVKGVGVRLWCETVQDINALADRIKRAGGVLTDGPTETPAMKMQSIGLDDPDGYHISIFRSTT